MLRFPDGADHDPSFITLIREICLGLIRRVVPDDVFLVQIDNWFDHKWLDLIVWNSQSAEALDEHTPIPMFNPSRVFTEEHYARTSDSDSGLHVAPVKEIHGDDGVARRKHRKPVHWTNNGVFLWYSGRTAHNGRGSLMALVYTPSLKFAWYVLLARRETWAIDRAKGIAPQELRSLAESISEKSN